MSPSLRVIHGKQSLDSKATFIFTWLCGPGHLSPSLGLRFLLCKMKELNWIATILLKSVCLCSLFDRQQGLVQTLR